MTLAALAIVPSMLAQPAFNIVAGRAIRPLSDPESAGCHNSGVAQDADQSAAASPTPLPPKARLRVKKGPIWPGGMVDVGLELSGASVRLEVLPRQLGRAERGTIKRLMGDEALAKADAGRRPAFEVPVREASFSFSDAPGKRTLIGVELAGKPKFALLFLDFSPVEDVADSSRTGVILSSTAKVLARGGDAREAREDERQSGPNSL